MVVLTGATEVLAGVVLHSDWVIEMMVKESVSVIVVVPLVESVFVTVLVTGASVVVVVSVSVPI